MGRLIGVVTSSRADFGPLAPLMAALKAEPDIELAVYVTGMHFSPDHGGTLSEIVDRGFGAEIVEVPAVCPDGTGAATAMAMGDGVQAFGRAFAARPPDILVVMGDRFDMFPAPLAAIAYNLPIAHISGGEITEGVIDDVIRHATSKMAHLHFASMEPYAANLRQMGEEDWRIEVVGEPGLDVTADYPDVTRADFLAAHGFRADRPVTLFTYHPESLFPDRSGGAIGRILAAADAVDTQILFTYPNNDPGSTPVLAAILDYAAAHDDCRAIESLGRHNFFNALAHVDAMVGNSSAGIVESASFGLPTVNIGERQAGRVAPKNVIACGDDIDDVRTAWTRALSTDFRATAAGTANPYGDGRASERIVARLKTVALDEILLRKKLVSFPAAAEASI